MPWFVPKIPAGWRKAFGLAAVLVACEPMTPSTGSCGKVPSCSVYDWRIDLDQIGNAGPDSAGFYSVDNLGFWLSIRPDFSPGSLACHSLGRSGVAHALSCAPCTVEKVVIDSLLFTTDMVLMTGDTLKAGRNFAPEANFPGFKGNGLLWQFDDSFPLRFRDSLFEVRFSGFVDTVRKSGSTAIRITNAALLLP